MRRSVEHKGRMLRFDRHLTALIAALALVGCSNSVSPPGPTEAASLTPSCYLSSAPKPDAAVAADSSFTMISNSDWNEDAVRRVLQVFAFGGFASPAQIETWAEMSPGAAIVEMLTFDATNSKLSPAEGFDSLNSIRPSMACLSTLWSQPHKQNKIPLQNRSELAPDAWNSAAKIYLQMITKRGWNPVRTRMGLWATNYHMATNLDVGVSNRQMIQYFDLITKAFEERKPFEEVLTAAALSAAVATQYGHKESRFVDGRFFGNDDFAREYFQLFFGILGVSNEYTSDYHETVTIPSMARALTDIRVPYIIFPNGSEGFDSVTQIGEDYHYPGVLQIMNAAVDGENASDRLATLAPLSIANAESLTNLPVMIISTLADDNLDDTRKNEIRAIWAGLNTKDLLTFLRKYAISTTFHHTDRVKYWTSIERNLLHINLASQSNFESYRGYYSPEWRINDESVALFRPVHNVFGHQTGLEAANGPAAFQTVYERTIQHYWYFARAEETTDRWRKDWRKNISANSAGNYTVANVAEQLWHHFIADGLKNFGVLERYHIYALLASGQDLGFFIDPEDPGHTYTEAELNAALADTTIGLGKVLSDLGSAKMLLASNNNDLRTQANWRIGMAVNFILATPFAFAQEGK